MSIQIDIVNLYIGMLRPFKYAIHYNTHTLMYIDTYCMYIVKFQVSMFQKVIFASSRICFDIHIFTNTIQIYDVIFQKQNKF